MSRQTEGQADSGMFWMHSLSSLQVTWGQGEFCIPRFRQRLVKETETLKQGRETQHRSEGLSTCFKEAEVNDASFWFEGKKKSACVTLTSKTHLWLARFFFFFRPEISVLAFVSL